MMPSRNDPCPCGSGKKYKRCCLEAKPKFFASFFRIQESESLEISAFEEFSDFFLDRLELPWIRRVLARQDQPVVTAVLSTPAAVTLTANFRDGLGEDNRTYGLELLKSANEKDWKIRCSCPAGRAIQICKHLSLGTYLLWSLYREEAPIAWNQLETQKAFDQALQRNILPPELEGVTLSAVYLVPVRSTEIHLFDLPEAQKIPGITAPTWQAMLKEYGSTRSRRPSRGWNLGSQLGIVGRSLSRTQLDAGIVLQYAFSDGQVWEPAELIDQPRAKLVPRGYFPGGTPSTEGLPGFVMMPSKGSKTQPYSSRYRGQLNLGEIGAFLTALADQVPCFLVSEPNPMDVRKSLRVKKADIRAQNTLITLTPQSENTAEFALNPEALSQRAWTWQEEVLTFFPTLPPFWDLKEFPYEMVGFKAIELSLQDTNRLLKEDGISPVQVQKELTPTLPGTLQIWLSPSEESGTLESASPGAVEIRFSSFWPDINAQVLNIQTSFLKVIQCLQRGIFALLDAQLDPKALACNTKTKRSNDLKLLKHTGFAALLVYEVFSYLCEPDAAVKVPPSGWKKDLLARLELFALQILEVPASSSDEPTRLKNIVSKGVITLISEGIDILLALQSPKQTERVYARSVVYCSPLLWREFMETTLSICNALVGSSQGAERNMLFYKSRTPLLLIPASPEDLYRNEAEPWVLTSQQSEAAPNWAKFEACAAFAKVPAMRILQELLSCSSRVQVFWNKQPIQFLDPKDLQAVFQIQDRLSTSAKALDWFDLHPKVFLRGRELEWGEVSEIRNSGTIAYEGKLYAVSPSQLPSVKRLVAFWERLRNPDKNKNGSNWDERTYKSVPKSETLEFLALAKSLGAEVKTESAQWQEVLRFYNSLDTPTGRLDLPKRFLGELKEYQRTGVQWLLDLYELRLGGILADEMGLGKTVQTLVFLEMLRAQGKLGTSMIVVPTSLSWNWKSEAARFVPDLPVKVFEGKDKATLESYWNEGAKPILLVVTYGLLLEHAEWFEGREGTPRRWSVVGFDEAQNLKNVSSKRSDISRRLLADFKFCLTGTPMENHLGELYSLIDLVVPGCLGSRVDFSQDTTLRLEGLMDPQSKALEIAFLKRKIKPLLLRRNKSQILKELPKKSETSTTLVLETGQKKIYRDIALSYNQEVARSIAQYGEAKSQLFMLTALLRLRQACSHPSCLPGVVYKKIPPKFEILLESLQEIIESGESALIFTQFLSTLENLQKFLIQNGIRVSTIHGGVSRSEREKILEQFQKSNQSEVLLMTLKTGGVGLNLTKASYVFHLEPWWNPAVENQATDRAHRIGQEKPVQVFRFLMKDTVEEKITTLKSQKAALFDAVIETSSQDESLEPSGQGLVHSKRILSKADFDFLLS